MPTHRRLAFGLSGLADNIVGTFIGVHLFVFYTDVVGLRPLYVSGGLTVALIWNAFSDFVMGRISDHTRWKAGRRRPYILLGALPVGIAFTLLLSPPTSLSQPALAVYFTATLLFLFTMKTMVQVPALSLLPELSRGTVERTKLAAAREQLGNVGDLLGLLLPIALVLLFDAENDAARARTAFGTAAVVIGSIATLALLGTFLGTREDREVPPPKPLALTELFRALRGNAPFRALLGAAALGALSLSFVQSMILYVLQHVMNEHDPVVHLGAFVVNAVAAILSYPLWTRFAAKVGKATAFRFGLGVSSLAFFSVFAIGPGDYLGLTLVMAFSGAANVGFWMLLHALNADCTDLDARRHGERREGLFAGFAALVKKLAIAGAAAGVGLGLTAIGYVEGVAPSAEVVFRLQLLFALPTTALALGALWTFRSYEWGNQPYAERSMRPSSPNTTPSLSSISR